MSFNDDITLTTTANPSGTVFSKTIETSNQTIRKDPSAPIGEPSEYRIAVNTNTVRQQTLAARSVSKMASDNVTLRTLKASVKLDIPIDGTFSASDIDEVVEEVASHVLGNLQKFRNGEK